MSAPVRHETFTALKARREALQIASSFLYKHIEIKPVFCRTCGRRLEFGPGVKLKQIKCGTCSNPAAVYTPSKVYRPYQEDAVEEVHPPQPADYRGLIKLLVATAGVVWLMVALCS